MLNIGIYEKASSKRRIKQMMDKNIFISILIALSYIMIDLKLVHISKKINSMRVYLFEAGKSSALFLILEYSSQIRYTYPYTTHIYLYKTFKNYPLASRI